MFRCELCDAYLSLFQLSHLCENCYKIRTIIKCYDSPKILDCLEQNFKVEYKTLSTPLPPIVEEEEKEVEEDTVRATEDFKKELEKKVLCSIQTRNCGKRKNNKDKNF